MLFAGLPSGVAAVTRAVLGTTPPAAGAVTTSEICEASAAASAGLRHVTSWPSTVHVHPAPDALAIATPSGSRSRTAIPAASPGPVSVIVIV